MWKMIIKQVETGRVWEETITEVDNRYRSQPIPKSTSEENAKERATQIVEFFNATLREGESPRELISVSFVDEKG